MQQPARIQKASISITVCKYYSEYCLYISSIIWVTQEKYQLLQVSPRKIEILIGGAPNKSGVGVGNFSRKWAGGCLFGTQE